MCRRNKFISGVVLAAVMMLGGVSFAEFKEGEKLPDLSGFQLEGKLPEELKGRVILLDFWASWCGPCKSSFPVMEEISKEFAGKGLTIIAVSVDEKEANVREFVKAAKVSFAVVRDGQHKLVAAADIRAMPTAFLIDRAGKIRFVHAGFDREKTKGEYVKEIEELLREGKP